MTLTVLEASKESRRAAATTEARHAAAQGAAGAAAAGTECFGGTGHGAVGEAMAVMGYVEVQ